MPEPVQIEVVTPQRVVLRERAEVVVVPSARGYLGVMAGHAPMVAVLEVGLVRFGRFHGPKRTLAVSGGFMEVSGNRVTILADAAELPEEIDVARARQARDRALARLRSRAADIDHARAQRALARALNRLRAAGVEPDS